MDNDKSRYELMDVMGVAELPKECDHWNATIWDLAINVAKSGGLEIAYMPNGSPEFIITGPRGIASLEAIKFAEARGSIAKQVARDSSRNQLCENANATHWQVKVVKDEQFRRGIRAACIKLAIALQDQTRGVKVPDATEDWFALLVDIAIERMDYLQRELKTKDNDTAEKSVASQIGINRKEGNHPLYETQLRLIGKIKAEIGSGDGKREGEPVDVALERLVDEACQYNQQLNRAVRRLTDSIKSAFRLDPGEYAGLSAIEELKTIVDEACDRYHSRVGEAPSMESDYAATVKALSGAIQVIAKEQKQTYAACNTLSNTLAEVVKNRMKLEESRSK